MTLPKSVELYCIGNAMVDVFADAAPEWLDRQGITAPAQHIPRDQAQKILDDLGGLPAKTGKRNVIVSAATGGAAANVAKVAASLKISAAFSGCIGGDDLGTFFEKNLKAAGVTPVLKTGTEKTGLCFVFNCGGQTRLAASPGASLEFTEADICKNLIAGADAVVLDGYILERRPLVRQIFQFADHRGIPVALDAASVFQIQEKTEDILQYSRNYPLIVFMNADECIAFYNTIKKGGGGIETVTEREKESLILKEICPVLKYMTEGEIFPVIVIKLGGRGAVVLAGGNSHREETFTFIPRNTVGAGDAFCAAFMSAWIRGKPVRECAALGNKVARKFLLNQN